MPRKPKQLPPPPEATNLVPPAVAEAPTVITEEAPAPSPVVASPPNTGCPVEYIGEGAELVTFTANPKATLIKVYANGIVVETL